MNKKNLIFFVFIIFLSCLIFYYFFNQSATPTVSPFHLSSSQTKLSTDSNLVQVTRVVDGDTIEIEGGEKVRYIGMNAPESVDPRRPIQCFGVEASKKNKELVLGKKVRLERDISDRDKYNRLLRYVWLGETMVNLKLTQDGYAGAFTFPPDVKYANEFKSAEREARSAGRGLWSACQNNLFGSVQDNSVSTSSSSMRSNCQIKGNISASGMKIYHLPGCIYYEKTQINETAGEKWFCSESEAVAAGWRKAANCQ